jgi:transglutaminase-like putative cysteine protease
MISKTYTHHIQRKAASFEKGPGSRSVEIVSLRKEDVPKIYSVVHKTQYSYQKPVPHSKHLFRLHPVQDIHQIVLSYELICSSTGQARSFVGVFENRASFLEITEPYQKISVVSQSIVALNPLSPDFFDSLHQPRTIPMIWMPWDRVMLQNYLQPPELSEAELFELSEYAMGFVKRNKNDIIEVLNDINQTIHREYTYLPEELSLSTSPYEVYFHKRGVCQDFSNLFICLARLLSVPARYRVGYVYTGGKAGNTQEDASHAWVEVFLPYMGWVGFDPTNGCLAGEKHIRVSCGRSYLDAAPTSGTIFGNVGEEQMSVSVHVTLLNE